MPGTCTSTPTRLIALAVLAMLSLAACTVSPATDATSATATATTSSLPATPSTTSSSSTVPSSPDKLVEPAILTQIDLDQACRDTFGADYLADASGDSARGISCINSDATAQPLTMEVISQRCASGSAWPLDESDPLSWQCLFVD